MSAAAIKCFGTAMEYGTTGCYGNGRTLITKFSPLVEIMIATSGKAVSASTFQPVMSAAVYVVSIIIEKCLVPLIAFSSVLAVAGNISDKVQLSVFVRWLSRFQSGLWRRS